jgi:hypothetical protein
MLRDVRHVAYILRNTSNLWSHHSVCESPFG